MISISFLALLGAGTVGLVILLATDQMEVERVTQCVALVRSTWASAAGLSGASIAAILSRYAIPAYLEYRRMTQQRSDERISKIIASQVEAVLASTKR